jgi:hypothetical protein
MPPATKIFEESSAGRTGKRLSALRWGSEPAGDAAGGIIGDPASAAGQRLAWPRFWTRPPAAPYMHANGETGKE